MELSVTERAEARALAAARKKYEAGKGVSQYEAGLILKYREPAAGGMIEYWAKGPDRPPSTRWPYSEQPVTVCGDCVMLDLKPIDSGIRQCRKTCTWRSREDEACRHGVRAVGLEEAIETLTMALYYATIKLTPWTLDDEEIPF